MNKVILVTATLVLLSPLNAYAQKAEGWEFSVGAGIMTSPGYLGDDEYQIMAVPNLKLTYEDTFFASIQDGIGYNIINNENWRVGPIARIDFGRDRDGNSPFRIDGGDNDDLRGLNDIDTTIELGAFIEYNVKPLALKAEIRQAAGGHEGLTGSAGADYKGNAHLMNKPVMFSFGPEINFADSNYHQSYFGVNAAEANSSGLSQYSPDAGMLSYGMGGTVIMPLTQNISTVFFANYNLLGEESADSSLVKQRGSKHQGNAGLFLNYTF